MQCKACEGQAAQHEVACVHHEVATPWYRQPGLFTLVSFMGVAVAAVALRLG